MTGELTGPALQIVRKFPDRKFSITHHCWYIVYDEDRLAQLKTALATICPVTVEGNYPQEVSPSKPESVAPIIVMDVPSEYIEALIRMRYSDATIRGYCSHFKLFLKYISPRGLDEIDSEMINRYQHYLVQARKVSLSTQNQAINSIKFFLEKVLHGERQLYYIERPRNEWKLPTVLSEEEMKSLLGATQNIKHRSMMYMMYSSGLRVSEVLRLRWEDIDRDRMMVYVRAAKGNKDRITILSRVAYECLVRYKDLYNPGTMLFEGPDKGPYSASSINKFIHHCAKVAGINKNVSAHTLRHCFATHLLERGVDLRYIQALLGHESSKTTERYTHITKKGFEGLVSPLDNLMPIHTLVE